MIEAVLLLAALLHRPVPLVEHVYDMGGIDVVSLFECESQFNPKAQRAEPRGHTSYGLPQLNDETHNQYREDILLSIVEGIRFYRDDCPGETVAEKVSHYNGGTNPPSASVKWGELVQRKRDSLAAYLWHRLR